MRSPRRWSASVAAVGVQMLDDEHLLIAALWHKLEVSVEVGRVRSEGHSRCIDDDVGLVGDRTSIPHSAPSANQAGAAHSRQRIQAVALPGITAGLALAGGAAHRSNIATWLSRHI